MRCWFALSVFNHSLLSTSEAAGENELGAGGADGVSSAVPRASNDDGAFAAAASAWASSSEDEAEVDDDEDADADEEGSESEVHGEEGNGGISGGTRRSPADISLAAIAVTSDGVIVDAVLPRPESYEGVMDDGGSTAVKKRRTGY